MKNTEIIFKLKTMEIFVYRSIEQNSIQSNEE